MAGGLRRCVEAVVMAAIALVLVLTFLQDFALLAGWKWPVRRALLLAGLGFDIFFTLEFLIRLYSALSRRETGRYMLRERGWIDFAASVPLLILNSAPAAAAVFAGGAAAGGFTGTLGLFTAGEAVRMNRTLRLLRLLKPLKWVRRGAAPMALRHVAKVGVSVGVTTVLIFVLWTALRAAVIGGGTDELIAAGRSETAARISAADSTDAVRRIAAGSSDVLLVKRGGETLYSRYKGGEYRRMFGPADYTVLRKAASAAYFTLLPQRGEYAAERILVFLVLAVVLLVLFFYYLPHFSMTVTDPLWIMRRGLGEPSYGLKVRIPRTYAQDDVYRLARLYNERFLALKERDKAAEHERRESDLALTDAEDIFRH